MKREMLCHQYEKRLSRLWKLQNYLQDVKRDFEGARKVRDRYYLILRQCREKTSARISEQYGVVK